MRTWRQFAAVILGASSSVLAGCPSQTANSVASTQIPDSSTPAARARQAKGIEQGRVHPALRAASRESPLSTFNSPEYGVSFRYPRNYALEEGNVMEHSFFLKRQEELDVEQPGARVVATVLIPDDAYPNTNFLHGSLQVTAKKSLPAEPCGLDFEPAVQRVRGVTIQSSILEGRESSLITAGTEIVERRYSGLSNGTCYEFSLVVAAGEPAESQDVKQADVAKIMRQLEKIVSSFQFHPKTEPASINATVD
jgi:hypothetical protein